MKQASSSATPSLLGLVRRSTNAFLRMVGAKPRARAGGPPVFEVKHKGVTTRFSAEDGYSQTWFYPRYAGGKLHEKRVTELLVDALQNATCFVDVGTNLGWYTCMAATHMPQGRVYGFELDDLNFSLLKRNLQMNSCTNVEVYNVAVSDGPGEVRYARPQNNPSPIFKLAVDGTGSDLITVKSISLDDFCGTAGARPQVMKIDVEGAEMQVLKGMSRILKDVRPILFLEVHPYTLPTFHTSVGEVLALLVKNGYRIFEISDLRDRDSDQDLKPISQDSVLEHNTMLYALPPESSHTA